jgi:mono/diheme cytochrome c family protein
MARRLVTAIISLLAFGETSRPATAAPVQGASIEIWVRGSTRAGAAAERLRPRRLKLDRLALASVDRRDVQYEAVRQYRGIAVSAILKRYGPDNSLDLAILHFANGMAIPLPFRDTATMKRLDPFIARGNFAAIPKKDVQGDRRPIEFSGNKVVVAEPFHPEMDPAAQPGFSPWMYADTLLGIELAAAGSYYSQFEVAGNATVQRGLRLFRQNCQFCHGVRSVGATFGWDFVDSEAIQSQQESAANLYHNVAYKPRNAGDLGLMMPALGFLTEADAGAMREWLRAVATVPMAPYEAPPRAR